MRTPQATLGPPLTPDFGSPVMPWSSLPWMMTAVPSASKSDSGPGDSVIARGDAGQLAGAVGADLEVRNVPHVERVVGVRIGVAGRAGIEVAAGGGEVRIALADRVQVHAVLARLEALGVERELDHGAGALRPLGERQRAGDAFALDVRVRFHACGLRAERRGARTGRSPLRPAGRSDVS